VWGELAQRSHFIERLSVGEIANEPIGVSSVCPRPEFVPDPNYSELLPNYFNPRFTGLRSVHQALFFEVTA
jgi:hypothetical protein